MVTPEWLRAQATRLQKLADDATATGNTAIANLITDAATRYLDQAATLELAQVAASTHDAPLMLQPQQLDRDNAPEVKE